MERLANKVVFITGSSSGIGEACARQFAAAGCKLILAARREERLEKLKQELLQVTKEGNIHICPLDVTNRHQVIKAIESIPIKFSPINILINNAGLALGAEHVEKATDEQIDMVLGTNVKGLLYVTQAILPIMRQHNGGHIINVGSVAGLAAYPNGGLYCASKHAVHALTQTLRMELINTPIRVTEIEPGLVETEFSLVRFGGDAARAATVYNGLVPLKGEDVAEVIVFCAGRPDHVQIADVVVYPTHQASVYHVHREQA